ncbi:response regulator [Desulfovibrionales bacterium]
MVSSIVPPITVLLIDDEAQFRETMGKRLRKRSFLVHQAGSGAEGLGILHATHVDVVVLDVRMPGMDGLQTLREIRMAFPQIPVVMLTGHGDSDAVISGMSMGAFEYLAKPADLSELITAIRAAVTWSKRGRGKSGQPATS